jgi:hypothetical protein
VESRTRQNYKQQDLIITHESESEITVDNTDVARFIGLLVGNEKIRDVIDTIGKEGGSPSTSRGCRSCSGRVSRTDRWKLVPSLATESLRGWGRTAGTPEEVTAALSRLVIHSGQAVLARMPGLTTWRRASFEFHADPVELGGVRSRSSNWRSFLDFHLRRSLRNLGIAPDVGLSHGPVPRVTPYPTHSGWRSKAQRGPWGLRLRSV